MRKSRKRPLVGRPFSTVEEGLSVEIRVATLRTILLVGKRDAKYADRYHKGKNKNDDRDIHFVPLSVIQ
jgi:hypothetical protein